MGVKVREQMSKGLRGSYLSSTASVGERSHAARTCRTVCCVCARAPHAPRQLEVHKLQPYMSRHRRVPTTPTVSSKQPRQGNRWADKPCKKMHQSAWHAHTDRGLQH